MQTQAEALLRVKCGDADLNAEVYVNGEFKGECPVDVQIPAGQVSLRVVKPAGEGKERVYEQSMRLADGTAKAVNAELSVLRWTAEGWKKEQARQAAEAVQDDAAWQSLGGGDSNQMQIYLSQFPAGRHAVEAKRRISQEWSGEMVPIPGKNYEIGKYEVTQKQWQVLMGENPSAFKKCGENCPVEFVSWDDIQIFLKKLNEKTGLQFRLPTKAEWIYACLGGAQTMYCGSDVLTEVAWTSGAGIFNSGNAAGTTHPVGQLKANTFGVYDMSGNVLEFVQDCHSNDCSVRLLLGGCWLSNPHDALAAADKMFIGSSGKIVGATGFRLARSIP